MVNYCRKWGQCFIFVSVIIGSCLLLVVVGYFCIVSVEFIYSKNSSLAVLLGIIEFVVVLTTVLTTTDIL